MILPKNILTINLFHNNLFDKENDLCIDIQINLTLRLRIDLLN